MVFPKPHKQLATKARIPRPGIALSKDDIAKLLKHFNGNVSRVADKLGCSRHTIHNRINNDPDLMRAKVDARERIIDELEESAWAKAVNGDGMMQMFLLKTIGRDRGYSMAEGNPLQDIARTAFEFVLNRSKNPAEIPVKPSDHVSLGSGSDTKVIELDIKSKV